MFLAMNLYILVAIFLLFFLKRQLTLYVSIFEEKIKYPYFTSFYTFTAQFNFLPFCFYFSSFFSDGKKLPILRDTINPAKANW